MILMLVIAGCSETNTQQQNTEQPFVGGGCGVQGYDSDGDVNQLPMEGNL